MHLRDLIGPAWTAAAVTQMMVRAAYPYEARRTIRRGPLKGHKIFVGPGIGFSYLWYLDHDDWNWVCHVRPNEVVYDIGANCGQSTLHLAAAVGHDGRVVAFEPMKRHFRRLTEHLQLNRVAQVTAVHAAISAIDGRAAFEFSDQMPTQGRLLSPTSVAMEVTETVTVDVLRLDSYKAQGWPAPSFVKIDVEGGARGVFEGGEEIFSSCRPRVFIELHSSDEQASVLHFMQKHRYRASSMSGADVPDPTAMWASPLFCQPI